MSLATTSAAVSAADRSAPAEGAALPVSTDLPGAASARPGSFEGAVPIAARHAKALCAFRRRARAAGADDRWEEERAARLVCQGVLSEREAEDALALVIAGRERMAGSLEDMTRALAIARTALAAAMTEERRARDALERQLRGAVREMMQARRPAAALLDRAREINAEAGGVFVWPELRRFVEWEAARFLRARGGMV